MASEAFDPFADDDGDEFLHSASPRDVHGGGPRNSPRGSPQRSVSSNVASQSSDPSSNHVNSFISHSQNNIQTDDIMQEFCTAFPSMSLNDNTTTDQFGFPSSCFPATFEVTGGEDKSKTNTTTSYPNPSPSNPAVRNSEAANFIVAEEMSVIYNSQSNQCSVKVRGNISLEASPNTNSVEQTISLIDPKGHIDAIASKNYDCAQPIASADEFSTMTPSHQTVIDKTFRISIPESDGQVDSWSGRPLIEYECGDRLRPVPMLVNTAIHELDDQCQIMFRLRVNPRNEKPLINAVVLISVPDEFDGASAQVCSVGRSIGKGSIDTNWSGVTRILSWKLGELYSGAICEIEALFPPSSVESVQNAHGPADMTETKFPVLLRYDSTGCLLSNADIDFGEGSNSSRVQRRFRVYHREI